MKLTCIGHQRLYDLQSIASAFFPGESTTDGQPEIISELSRQPQLGCLSVLRDTDQEIRSFVPCEGTDDSAIRDAVKRSFFDVAVKYTGFTPDWGTFTGIRPAREFDKMQLSAQAFAEVFRMSPEKADLCSRIIDVRRKLTLPAGEDDTSLYVSIPFCPTRCAYCSFISGAGEKMLGLIPTYLNALHRELSAVAQLVSRRGLTVRTVYIGGGTPAILTAQQLSTLILHIHELFGKNIVEFTVELGRPDVITDEKLHAVYAAGVDRVCINPQTLNDAILKAIGRRHTTDQFIEAMTNARKYNFRAINCDLIAGLPGDTPDGFADSLDQIMTLGAQNVTVHALCIKQGSDLKSHGGTVLRAKIASEMVNHSVKRLMVGRYHPYYLYKQKHAVAALENTGWATEGTESYYNIIMMDDLGTVLGVGAGSSSKILGGRTPVRVYAPKYPYEYLRDAGDFSAKIQALESAFEQRKGFE